MIKPLLLSDAVSEPVVYPAAVETNTVSTPPPTPMENGIVTPVMKFLTVPVVALLQLITIFN